jgi:DNA polymerase
MESCRLSSVKLLDAVATEVVVCKKCPLWETRRNAVPGEGSPKSKIVCIGEAPGRSEDIQGRPFVGAAGKLLTQLLSCIGLSREDVFICNIVKCRPPRNRAPSPAEVEACTPYLDRQINAIKPKIIVTLGHHSTTCVFSKTQLPFSSITRVRGKSSDTAILGRRVTVFPTLHPAAALYNGEYRKQLTEDFRMLRGIAKEKGIIKSS